MEKMIRDIVDADREARLRLLEKQKEKDNIQSLIREERASRQSICRTRKNAFARNARSCRRS